MRRYCTEQTITFARLRPGNSNGGAHREQKNWARVRELVGYYRYDTGADVDKLNEIREPDRIVVRASDHVEDLLDDAVAEGLLLDNSQVRRVAVGCSKQALACSE